MPADSAWNLILKNRTDFNGLDTLNVIVSQTYKIKGRHFRIVNGKLKVFNRIGQIVPPDSIEVGKLFLKGKKFNRRQWIRSGLGKPALYKRWRLKKLPGGNILRQRLADKTGEPEDDVGKSKRKKVTIKRIK